MRPDTADYLSLFLADTPLLDTRAPIEFKRGAFPCAHNLPLLDDEERERIGTCFKQQGQQAATELGHRLVSGAVKQTRLEGWSAFAQQHPNGYLFCFRGGMRSHVVQQWLADAGINYPRVHGGYKAMRHFLIGSLELTVKQHPFIVVAGLTGSGKTDVIRAVPNALDLEAYANHRGSSFGRHVSGQPSQIDFENRTAIDMLKLCNSGHKQLIVEDEGRLIGRCFVPASLQLCIKNAPLVWLEDSLENRVDRILNEYIVQMLAEFQEKHPADSAAAFAALADYLRISLQRIHKRLGGERHERLQKLLSYALEQQEKYQEVSAHRLWITALLQEYYDPMYTFQRGAKSQRILLRGNLQAVIEYLKTAPHVL